MCWFSVGNTTRGLPFVEFIIKEHGNANLSSIWLSDEETLDIDDNERDEDDPLDLEDEENEEIEEIELEDIELLDSEDCEGRETEDEEIEDVDNEDPEDALNWLEEEPEDIRLSYSLFIYIDSKSKIMFAKSISFTFAE